MAWTHHCCRVLLFIAVLLVLLLAATVLSAQWRARHRDGPPQWRLGGASHGPGRGGGPPDAPRPADAPPATDTGLSQALYNYARALGPEDAIGVHPLHQDHYSSPSSEALGGMGWPSQLGAAPHSAPAPSAKKRASRRAKKTWHGYATWDALRADEAAASEYLADRAAVLESPGLDWSHVLAEILPKLGEKREYIGLINLDEDGETLRVTQYEASPLSAAESRTETTYASVPGALVEKYISRPALFVFHTHPDDPKCSPLPSSHDLSVAIHLGATARYAANVIISNYGVLVYGLSWCAYKALNSAEDRRLAYLNYSHDVVAAHEATRSWAPYTLDDYLAFYPRHRLFCYAYPSSRMVADRRRTYSWSLEAPIDLELIAEHRRDITSYLKKSGRHRQASGHFGHAGLDPAPVPGPPHVATPGEAGSCKALPPPSVLEAFRPVTDLPPTDLGFD